MLSEYKVNIYNIDISTYFVEMFLNVYFLNKYKEYTYFLIGGIMKKICVFLILFIIPFSVFGEEVNLAENAGSAIMIEASTGEVLYKKKVNERMAPASMTKIMSLILIMENIESGRLKWNDIVVVSANAASMGGSQIFLETNEMMTVEDLVKGICIASGNDVVVTKKQSPVIREETII